jgi:hypothetical protein
MRKERKYYTGEVKVAVLSWLSLKWRSDVLR